MKQITVIAYMDRNNTRYSDFDLTFDTVKEAKAKAKYWVSKDYPKFNEGTREFDYTQVVVNGECIADYFAAKD